MGAVFSHVCVRVWHTKTNRVVVRRFQRNKAWFWHKSWEEVCKESKIIVQVETASLGCEEWNCRRWVTCISTLSHNRYHDKEKLFSHGWNKRKYQWSMTFLREVETSKQPKTTCVLTPPKLMSHALYLSCFGIQIIFLCVGWCCVYLDVPMLGWCDIIQTSTLTSSMLALYHIGSK